MNFHAPMAQLDSASVFGTEGSRFESWWVYSSHPANYRQHASSRIERFFIAAIRSLKSQLFWAFLIFRTLLAALSLYHTASKLSGCCFRLKGIFYRELSRSLVGKWLLVTTPIASDPPSPPPNYPTAGFTAYRVQKRSSLNLCVVELLGCKPIFVLSPPAYDAL